MHAMTITNNNNNPTSNTTIIAENIDNKLVNNNNNNNNKELSRIPSTIQCINDEKSCYIQILKLITTMKRATHGVIDMSGMYCILLLLTIVINIIIIILSSSGNLIRLLPLFL